MIRFKSLVIYSNIQSVPENCAEKSQKQLIFSLHLGKSVSGYFVTNLIDPIHERPNSFLVPQSRFTSTPNTFHVRPKNWFLVLNISSKWLIMIEVFLRAPQNPFYYEIIWMFRANFSECSNLSIMIEIY